MSKNRYEGKDEAFLAKDAIDAWEGGACNPRGLSRSLVDMIDWYCERGNGHDGSKRQAPIAVLQAQLLFILGFGIGDLPGDNVDHYLAECRKLIAAKEAA